MKAKVLVLSALAISSFGCKEMSQKNAIINRYHVQIDSLYDAKGRARAMHDSTFDATAAKIQKEIQADSALLASGNATEQDRFDIEAKKNLVYPVVVRKLKVQIIDKNDEQRLSSGKSTASGQSGMRRSLLAGA